MINIYIIINNKAMKEGTFSQKALEISYKARWLFLTFILFGLQFVPFPSENWPNIYLLLVIFLIYNISTRFLNLPEIYERTRNICYAETVMDTIFLIGIIYLTGGYNSPFWIFFIVIIMFSAIYYSPGKTLLITLGICLLYILILILSGANFKNIIPILCLKIPVLFAVCGLSIFSSIEIRSQGEELEIEKEKVKHLLRAFHHNVVAIQKKNKVLSEVYNISLKTQGDISLSEQLTNICNTTISFLNLDISGIWLMEKNESLKLTGGTKNIPPSFPEKTRIGEGPIGRTVLKKEPLVINDLLKWDPSQFKNGPAFYIGIPLIVDNECLGVFVCASSYSKEFKEEDYLKFLLLIACRTSLSIKNAYLNEEIKRMTITDELTGLYNYKYFIETLKKEIHKAERFSCSLSLLMIDIDNFKEFNEKYGHHIGNQMLCALALNLTGSLRENDFLARFGEEEFVAILPSADKGEGIMVSERIRKCVSEATLVENTEPITVSIGVSSFPQDGKKFDEILLYADRAMTIAKEKGKNRTIGWKKK
ncbi:MAG: sensor domain-containing diguanylate cyclase [bacterium]